MIMKFWNWLLSFLGIRKEEANMGAELTEDQINSILKALGDLKERDEDASGQNGVDAVMEPFRQNTRTVPQFTHSEIEEMYQEFKTMVDEELKKDA